MGCSCIAGEGVLTTPGSGHKVRLTSRESEGEAQSAIDVADLVVIPVKPSPHDLRGVGVTADLCKRTARPFIFGRGASGAAVDPHSAGPLIRSQFGPVATSIIYKRVGL